MPTPSSRRSSSNGVQTLRAIFERSSSVDSSPSGSSSTAPSSRRVTSSFIPVEPFVRRPRSESRPSSSTSSMEGGLERDSSEPEDQVGLRFREEVDGNAGLDVSLKEYQSQDETHCERVVVAAAVVKAEDAEGPTAVLLLRRAEREDGVDLFPGNFELPWVTVREEDGSVLRALLGALRRQTGLVEKEVVARLPHVLFTDQEMALQEDGCEKLDVRSAVQITYIVAVDSQQEDVVLGSGEHNAFTWATLEDIGELKMTAPMDQALRSAFEYTKTYGGRAGNHGQGEKGAGEAAKPPAVETSGQFHALSEQDEAALRAAASPSGSPAQQVFSLPEQHTQSEHTEKSVSAVEDEEAELLPADMKQTATLESIRPEPPASETVTVDSTLSEPPANETAEGDEVEESTGITSSTIQNGTTGTNGQEDKRSSPAKSNTQRLSSAPAISKGVSKVSSNKALTSETSSTKAGTTRSTGSSTTSKPTHLPDRTRPTKPTTSTQPNAPAPSQPKLKSPLRSSRAVSNPTAPTASSSAKHEPSTAPTRTAPSRARRPIEGHPHFLASTTASAAKTDPLSTTDSTKQQYAPPVKLSEAIRRDRTSTASSSPNGTLKKSTTTAPPRSSLQPSNGAASKQQPGSRVPSNGSAAPKVPSGDFLARMMRPTAASSSKVADKSEAKIASATPSSSKSDAPAAKGSMRGKPKENSYGALTKRTGTGREGPVGDGGGNTAAKGQGDANGAGRGRTNGAAPADGAVNGRQSSRKEGDMEAVREHGEGEADATTGVKESNSGGDKSATEGEAGVVEEEEQGDDEVESGGVSVGGDGGKGEGEEQGQGKTRDDAEERMMETPELGGRVGVIR